jgi:hypothetical protein
MAQKGEEIPRASHSRQGLLAMAIVRFERLALGFEDMVVLVRDLLARSSSLHN